MLTQQLRDLERHGLVNCVFFPEMPPHSEYSVTMLRRTLHPIFKSVCDGAEENFGHVEKALARHQKA